MEGVDLKQNKEASRSPEKTAESKPAKEIRQEVLSSIKNGTDKEGEKLFNAYKDSIKDPEKSSFAGETYRKAQFSHEHIETDGEANKLVASLDALCRQAGIEEGYKPDIKKEGELSADEIQKAIRDKVAEDFQNYPELYAENKIGRYVDASVKVKEVESKAVESVDKDMVSRADLRAAIFQVQQARTGLYSVIEEESKQIKDQELGNELVESIKSGLTFEDKPLDKGFDELDEQKKGELAGESADEYKKLNFDAHEKHIGAVDGLTDEEKMNTFGKAAEIDREIQNKKDNLKEAMINSPDEAVELASELRSLQVEKRLRMSEASVAIAKKRSEISKAEWRAAAGSVLTGLIPRKGQKEGVLGKFKDSTSEWISSKKDEIGIRIGKDVKAATSELGEGIDGNFDGLRAFYEKVDDKLLSRVRGATEKVSTKIKNYREDLRDSKAKVEADIERRKIIARKTLFRSKHKTKNYYRESMVTIATGWRSSKETTWLNLIGKAGEIVGNEEVSESVKHRREVLKRYESVFAGARVDAIHKSENPYMDAFSKDLEKRFGLVEKVIEPSLQEGGGQGGKTQEKVNRPAKVESKPKPTQTTEDEKKKTKPEKFSTSKGLDVLSSQELDSRRISDKENFDKTRQNIDQDSRGKNWETTLKKANDRYWGVLKEVDRRINIKLTEHRIKTIEDYKPE